MIEQIAAAPLNLSASFWALLLGNASGNLTAALQQDYPPLVTCTDTTSKPPLSCPQAGDLIWNAYQDLVSQLNDQQCATAAQSNLFSKFTGGDANGVPITKESFVTYVNHQPRFLDATRSTLSYKMAKCGEKNRPNCNGNGLTVMGTLDSSTTAMTVTPSYPLKIFWQPSFTPPPQGSVFGVGIDPSNNGVNIMNESVFVHEALHGMTALYDEDFYPLLPNVSAPSDNISIYIQNHVLNQCPRFRGGQ